MKYRKLTEEGDYTFGGGPNNFIEGTEAIAQKIKTTLLLFYGEWWEDLTIGLPMFQSILGQVNTQNVSIALKNLVETKLLSIEGVQQIQDINIDIHERNITLTVALTVNDEYIEVEVAQ